MNDTTCIFFRNIPEQYREYLRIILVTLYGCSNGAKFSHFYYTCSVLNYLYSVSSYSYSFISYICSVLSYLIQSSFLYSVSHTLQENIVPHILSCSRFRKNQIELRKRQIQKYKNTENRIFNSDKNIVEKTET